MTPPGTLLRHARDRLAIVLFPEGVSDDPWLIVLSSSGALRTRWDSPTTIDGDVIADHTGAGAEKD